ncbi:MAG: WD40 repeat domain-containing protein [Thermogutta sp.]|jgi:WD40 repeat protein
MKIRWCAFPVMTAVVWAVFQGFLGAQTPTVLSSFHIVDMKKRGETRAPVITALDIDAAHNLLATAGDDHQIRLFGSGGDQLLATWPSEGWVYDLSFDPTGRYLAAVNEWGVLTVWEWQSPRQLYRLQVSGAALRAVSFSPDGRVIAVAGFDPTLVILESLTGRIVRQISTGVRDQRDAAFSPDGRFVAVTGGSGRVQLWEVSTGRLVVNQTVAPRRQRALAFAPTGQVLAVGGEDGRVRVFAVSGTSLQLVTTLELGEGQITTLTFCNGGEEIAAGTSRNEIRVFELASGREIGRLRGHTGTVARLVWTAEQGVLASGSFDTTIRFWQLPAATVVGERSATTVPGAVRQ